MSSEDDLKFFKLRKAAKTYISKVFTYGASDTEPKRQVRMVIEGNDSLQLGEIDGALCLRLTGNIRKTQVTAIVAQDDKGVKRLSLQTYASRSGGWIQTSEKNEFTFRSDEFERILRFLAQIEFIDLSNRDNFQIEDISTQDGPKTIIDARDQGAVEFFKNIPEQNRESILRGMRTELSADDINILLGRKQGLEEFEAQMESKDWVEARWQDFFEREQWVFGYGLDYRIMRQFDREMTIGSGGTDNRDKPVIDHLMSFNDYTALVEIKTPETPIFKPNRGNKSRAGTWQFSSEFIGAVSQILEQKAEWLSFANSGVHLNKAGTEQLKARTRNAKSILVIGSQKEFLQGANIRDQNIMRDTFELFRRETTNIDIVTFDELLERAKFITTR